MTVLQAEMRNLDPHAPLDNLFIAQGLALLDARYNRATNDTLFRHTAQVLKSAGLTNVQFQSGISSVLATEAFYPPPALIVERARGVSLDEVASRVFADICKLLKSGAHIPVSEPEMALLNSITCGRGNQLISDDKSSERLPFVRREFVSAYTLHLRNEELQGAGLANADAIVARLSAAVVRRAPLPAPEVTPEQQAENRVNFEALVTRLAPPKPALPEVFTPTDETARRQAQLALLRAAAENALSSVNERKEQN